MDRVRSAIHELEPDAQIILYGSRARREAQPDSDWDLLVLVDGPVDAQLRDAIYRRCLDLGLETGESLQPFLYSKQQWDSFPLRAAPFHDNVERDGLDVDDSLKPLPRRRRPRRSKALTEARNEIIRDFLERSDEALDGADQMARSSLWNSCVNRIYYACFYAASALLLHRNLSSHRHTGIRELFNLEFGRSELFSPELRSLYNGLFEERTRGDYKPFVRFGEDQVRPWLAQAHQFVRRAEEIMASSGDPQT